MSVFIELSKLINLFKTAEKSGLFVVQGIIFDNTVKVCIDTLESGSSNPEIRQFMQLLSISLDLRLKSFNFVKASIFLTQSPFISCSLIWSTGPGFILGLRPGDFIVNSVDFEYLVKGVSASVLAKFSFK